MQTAPPILIGEAVFLLHQAFALLGLPLELFHRQTKRDAGPLNFEYSGLLGTR